MELGKTDVQVFRLLISEMQVSSMVESKTLRRKLGRMALNRKYRLKDTCLIVIVVRQVKAGR